MENKNQKGYVVSHTHWDREWRYPLWENRMYLCDLLDELLDVLREDPSFHSFLLDGQSVIVEDYLSMRPKRREEMLEAIRTNRIQIGPFYTLPDLYPISGESIVRNLLRGEEECKRLGGRLDIAYESFGWGQPSQLPQIYKGFGINTVIVSKNVDKTRAPHCEFLWEGQDGTQILATRLGIEARANFYMNSYLEIVYSRAYHSAEYKYEPGKMGRHYHQAGSSGHTEDYFLLEDITAVDEDRVPGTIKRSWDNMKDSLLSDDRILMCGSDSTGAQKHISDIIE